LGKLGSLAARVRGSRGPGAIVVNVLLDTAATDKEYAIAGAGLVVEKLTGTVYCKVNSPTGDLLDLRHVLQVRGPFTGFYLTWTAQAGQVLKVLVIQDGFDVVHKSPPAIAGAYLAPTALGAGATADVWDPGSTGRLKLKRISISVNAATELDLLWGSTPWESYFLSANGTVIVNLTNCEETGPLGSKLVVKAVAAATVTARASGDVV
jgi:hypothetical protein